MKHFLSERQRGLQEAARIIACTEIAPRAAAMDEWGAPPADLHRILAGAHLFAAAIPRAYGGLDGGVLERAVIIEELSRACPGVALGYAASTAAAIPILLYGSEEQKRCFLPELAGGRKLGAFALSEANAGSDAAGIEMTAVPDGDGYVLNGTKQWVTNGGEADLYVVVALTSPARGARGASAFIVEKGVSGLAFGPRIQTMGVRAAAICDLIFSDCRIPRSALLGKEGQGFVLALKTLDRTRPGIGGQAVGIGQGALDLAARHACQRRQFGQAIGAFQAVRHMLADMATQVEAARALVYGVARLIDSGAEEFTGEAAMCKLFASDTAMRVTTDALQLLGGYGYLRGNPAEKLMRDAKATQIYEGTNQIQRNVIGSNLLKRYSSGR